MNAPYRIASHPENRGKSINELQWFQSRKVREYGENSDNQASQGIFWGEAEKKYFDRSVVFMLIFCLCYI